MAYTGKYKTPTELLNDDSLSHDEKVEMLEQWREDKEVLMRASDEGMQGDFRSDFLTTIQNALTSLKEGLLRDSNSAHDLRVKIQLENIANVDERSLQQHSSQRSTCQVPSGRASLSHHNDVTRMHSPLIVR